MAWWSLPNLILEVEAEWMCSLTAAILQFRVLEGVKKWGKKLRWTHQLSIAVHYNLWVITERIAFELHWESRVMIY